MKSLAVGTKIKMSDSNTKSIEEIETGDEVMCCGADLNWKSRKVRFSAGIDSVYETVLIKITYGEDDYILATSDQLFLVEDGKLRRADRLVPGVDKLFRDNGEKVCVNNLEVGLYKKGVHHIGTDDKPAFDMDGHLISMNGIVCADFCLGMGINL